MSIFKSTVALLAARENEITVFEREIWLKPWNMNFYFVSSTNWLQHVRSLMSDLVNLLLPVVVYFPYLEARALPLITGALIAFYTILKTISQINPPCSLTVNLITNLCKKYYTYWTFPIGLCQKNSPRLENFIKCNFFNIKSLSPLLISNLILNYYTWNEYKSNYQYTSYI